MCVSNNFVEQQAYEMSENIRINSLYNVVKVDFSDGNSLGSQHLNDHWNGSSLITKVILENKDGTIFPVEPNQNGLRFAKGEITYKEYEKLQKKENSYGFACIFLILGFFSIMMFVLMRFVV